MHFIPCQHNTLAIFTAYNYGCFNANQMYVGDKHAAKITTVFSANYSTSLPWSKTFLSSILAGYIDRKILYESNYFHYRQDLFFSCSTLSQLS